MFHELDPREVFAPYEGDPGFTDEPHAQCVHCGSGRIETRKYDFGRDPDNGYSDSGTQVYCVDCGKADEL